MVNTTNQSDAKSAYESQRAQLVMQMAQGQDTTSAIQKLDAAWQATLSSQALAEDVARAQSSLAAQAAQTVALQNYDAACIELRTLTSAANTAADTFEASFVQARADLQSWKDAVEAARAAHMQIQALSSQVMGVQGGWRNHVPHMIATGSLTVQLVDNAGQAAVQRILYDGAVWRFGDVTGPRI